MSSPLTPQEAVERGLAASGADGCIVLANHDASTNLRWANNTLTTNGVTQSLSVTVVSTVDGPDGAAVAGAASASAEDVNAQPAMDVRRIFFIVVTSL